MRQSGCQVPKSSNGQKYTQKLKSHVIPTYKYYMIEFLYDCIPDPYSRLFKLQIQKHMAGLQLWPMDPLCLLLVSLL